MTFTELLEAKGTNPFELARKSGVNHMVLYRMKMGEVDPRRLRVGTVYRIAKALGVTMDDIVDPATIGTGNYVTRKRGNDNEE